MRQLASLLAVVAVHFHQVGCQGSRLNATLLALGTDSFSASWPNPRLEAATWHVSKQQGTLAMFGGTGIYTDETHSFEETLNLADFWLFHPVTNGTIRPNCSDHCDPVTVQDDDTNSHITMQWTLVSNLGQDDPLATTSSTPPIDTDKPRGRTGALTWTTLRKGADGSYSQEFWMFGGKGYAVSGQEGYVNDMWRLTIPVVNETQDAVEVFQSLRWERIGWGSSTGNITAGYGIYTATNESQPWPGARQSAGTWTHNSNLWLFGGLGFGAAPLGDTDFSAVEAHFGYMNDIWEFDTETFEWTWHSGSSLPHVYGVYESDDIDAAPLSPGGRAKSSVWISTLSYELFVFGGYGFTKAGGAGYLDDLWKMNLGTLTWEWVGGRETRPNQAGTYAGPAQWPGGRAGAAALNVPRCTSETLLFLYGGYGYTEDALYQTRLGDAWLYNASSESWTFVVGSAEGNTVTSYGSADEGPSLGGRAFSALWRFAPVDKLSCFTEGGDITTLSLLLFGGGGFRDGSTSEFQNDLWMLVVDIDGSDVWLTVVLATAALLLVGAATTTIICVCCPRVRKKFFRESLCCRYRKYSRVFDVL